jgi:formylglycine-generating enzyme required for sulfatase activity
MFLAATAAFLLTAACSPEPQSPPAATPETAAAPCPAMPQQDYRWIAGGTLERGHDARLAEEAGTHSTAVAGFWMATHEVTNAEFAEFVRATGYLTLAERTPPIIAGSPPEMQQPGSAVFTVPTDGNPNWWRWVVGANWRQPQGPSAATPLGPRHPAVQIAYDDALAYAKWAGKALPSEDQWEWAARSGGADPDAPPEKQGKPSANTYQGSFPFDDQGRDGYRGSAPVACFPADRNGLYDMIGNVWEWTRDAQDSERNIIKGGSYLCASNYCARYRPAARQFQERSLGTDHIGFRLVDPSRPAPAP